MAVDNNHKYPCHKDLHQTNLTLDEDRINGVVDHEDPCPRDVCRDCEDTRQGDVVAANKVCTDSLQRYFVAVGNICKREMFGAANEDHKDPYQRGTVAADKNDKHLCQEDMAIPQDVV